MGESIRLRELRDRKFLTQQGLADLAGVSKVTIARIEIGAVLPTVTTIRKLATALRVEPDELVPDPAVLHRPRRLRRNPEFPD